VASLLTGYLFEGSGSAPNAFDAGPGDRPPAVLAHATKRFAAMGGQPRAAVEAAAAQMRAREWHHKIAVAIIAW